MDNRKGKITEQSQEDAPQAPITNPELEKGRVKKYVVPAGEEGAVHAEIEQVQFETGTGRKKSVPTVQKFDPRAWNNFREACRSLGYTYVKVLHAPEGTPTEIAELRN